MNRYVIQEDRLHADTIAFNARFDPNLMEVCRTLAIEIDRYLPEAENKIWHAHPVMVFKREPDRRLQQTEARYTLMFWSGADFGEHDLDVLGKKFKDASIFYNNANEIDVINLRRWLEKAKRIQWDYKNIIRNKGLRKVEEE
jgi:hypothetical protein